MDIVTLDDGSSILLTEVDVYGPAEVGQPDGTLGAGEVESFVVEAVAAGITFDVIKALVAGLVARGRMRLKRPVDAASVRDVVVGYLLSSGFSDVKATEVRHVPGHGWSLRGTADSMAFEALGDEAGQLVHVRVR
ncbi:hypothetical protein [Kribbella ginsengisoli]|uniref:Uncharacterized protein n=1 Tax=Kribbella ginsengisoli TaxID=363865 RepID=A0ABP6VJS7_9ACTN